jgi:multiple sugar transport system permease protein
VLAEGRVGEAAEGSDGKPPAPTQVLQTEPKRRRSHRRVATRTIVLVVLVGVGLFFLIPIVWLLLAPTKSHTALIANGPFAFGSFSQLGTTWHNLYTYENGVILIWLRNSATYTLAGTIIGVCVAIPAGYGLAVTQFVGRKVLLSVTLVVMLVPANALALPLFLGFNDIHMVGNVFSVILPFGFFPFGVYLAYIYFSTALPEELLAASRIDGCTEWNTFRYIAVPLAKPVIGLVFFFSFVGNWNNFFLPFLMLPQTGRLPASVGLEQLLSISPAFNPSNGGQFSSLWQPQICLAIIITIAPIMLVFIFAQRTLVKGLLAGSTKE